MQRNKESQDVYQTNQVKDSKDKILTEDEEIKER